EAPVTRTVFVTPFWRPDIFILPERELVRSEEFVIAEKVLLLVVCSGIMLWEDGLKRESSSRLGERLT
ncbi:MAG TPA: hypothetical protein VE177_06925, partial [Candidatus Binatus sp.]|nr:hypothetical protein [Candidatus Binatus sp.]